MNGYLVDTNILGELTRIQPQPSVVEWVNNTFDEDLFVSVISIGEICRGFSVLPPGPKRTRLEQWLENDLRPWFADRILPIDEATAEKWGRLDALHQGIGKPLNVADGLIAATAIQNGPTVVTRNSRDFSNLSVELLNPWME